MVGTKSGDFAQHTTRTLVFLSRLRGAGNFSTYNTNMIVVGPSDAIMNVGMVCNFVINGGTYYYYQNGILLNINPEKK
jgi:hypothetical protein